MKINKTALGVGLFIVGLLAAGFAAKSEADTVHIGIGKSVINSHLKVGEIGYEHKNAWAFGPTMTVDAGQTITLGLNSFWTIANGGYNEYIKN